MMSIPPRSAGLPPGYDEEDPYEGEDLSTYPEWWLRNIKLFREFDLRPYRPPRLKEGEILPPLIDELETKYDLDILFRSSDSKAKNWELVVDGQTIQRIDRERDGSGYPIYGITAEELKEAVHK